MLRAKQEQLSQNPELDGTLRRTASFEPLPANRCREVLLLESSAWHAALKQSKSHDDDHHHRDEPKTKLVQKPLIGLFQT
jgi:hypothetical protein